MTGAPLPSEARLLAERRGRVLVLTLSNPAARNAMSPDVYRAAVPICRKAAADRGIGAILLTGEGEHFCGGGNLNRLRAQRELPPETQAENLDALHDWISALRACPQPVIAAVEGAAAGGGFSLCLACDLIVAAADAKFVMSYAKVGLSPDGGGSHALAQALPAQLALEILLDAAPIAAARLHQLGIVNRVVPPGSACAEALRWAERLAQGPAEAQGRIKQLVYAARTRGHRAQLDAERDNFVEALYSNESGEGIAAFLERRPPRFLP